MCKLQIPTAKVAKVFSFQNVGFKKLANASTRTGTGIALAARRWAACLYCAMPPAIKRLVPAPAWLQLHRAGTNVHFMP